MPAVGILREEMVAGTGIFEYTQVTSPGSWRSKVPSAYSHTNKGVYSRSSNSRAHISNEEAAIWLSTYLISDGPKDTTIALLEYRLVWIGCVLELVRWKRYRLWLEDLQSRKPCPVSSGEKGVLRLPVSCHQEKVRGGEGNCQR